MNEWKMFQDIDSLNKISTGLENVNSKVENVLVDVASLKGNQVSQSVTQLGADLGNRLKAMNYFMLMKNVRIHH